MNRIRLLGMNLLAIFALTAVALSAQTQSAAAISDVDQHVKMLSEKLDLTTDQQAKVRPILQEMHDATEKIMQDESMSPDERAGLAKQVFYKADRKARQLLSDEQKKKLDQMEEDMHHGQHGN